MCRKLFTDFRENIKIHKAVNFAESTLYITLTSVIRDTFDTSQFLLIAKKCWTKPKGNPTVTQEE